MTVALDWYASGDVMGRGKLNLQSIYDMLKIKNEKTYFQGTTYDDKTDTQLTKIAGIDNINELNNDTIGHFLTGIVKDQKGFYQFPNWAMVFNSKFGEESIEFKNIKDGKWKSTVEIKPDESLTPLNVPDTHHQELVSIRNNKWSIVYPIMDDQTVDENKYLHFFYNNMPQTIILPEIHSMDLENVNEFSKLFGKYWMLKQNNQKTLAFYYRQTVNDAYSPQIMTNPVKYVSYAKELIDPARYVSYAQMF